MCNEYQQRVKRGLNDDAFSQIKVPLTWTDPEPNESGDAHDLSGASGSVG